MIEILVFTDSCMDGRFVHELTLLRRVSTHCHQIREP